MTGPWLKYQGGAAATADGPWSKYRAAEPAQQPQEPQSRAYEGWGDYGKDFARTALQGVTLGFGDEAIAGARSLAGTDYDQALDEERAAIERFREENPGTALAAELAGGFAVPGMGAARFISKAATMPRAMGRGAAVGTGFGGVSGYGHGKDGVENRLEEAQTGAAFGAGVGAVIPPAANMAAAGARAVHSAVSPQIARLQGNVKAQVDAFWDKYGIKMSADGGGPPIATPGADAAADQIIANQLSRAGKTVEDLDEVLAGHSRSSQFHSNSRAPDALAPVDLDPSLQRLAGSVVRQSPEAGNAAKGFVYGRQTGRTPQSGEIPGIPTRDRMSRPGNRPTGQRERVRDALKRALLISDDDFHGHGSSAYATEKQILARAKEQAKELYGQAYTAGQNVDLRPSITPILDKWRQIAQEEPEPVAKAINAVIKLFESKNGPVHNIERFDKSKQFMDGVIDRYFQAPEGRNQYLGGVLTGFKNELLGAVDSVQAGGLGQKYSAARGAFGSEMEMVEALRLGREVFKEGSELTADVFASMATPGQQKLFRLGLFDGFDQRMAGMKSTQDITQIFESPRVEAILSTVIPKTQTATGRVKMQGGAPAEFADRPERFGRYLEGERKMIETRDEVFGNSKTAQRAADDEAYEGLASLVDTVRATPSMTALGVKMVENALSKFFGYRADTAASIGRKLFAAEPRARREALEAVRARLDRDRFGHFLRLMREYEVALTSAGAGQAGAVGGL